VACVQASALYGAELWWDGREGSKVKNRCELQNQLGRAISRELANH